MYGYCNTCTFIHNFTPTDVGVFRVKMCISQHYFYLALTNASALYVVHHKFGIILPLYGSLHYTYIEPRGNPWPCVFTVLVAITLKWKINLDWPKNLY